MNLPNKLSVLRMFLVPVFVAIMVLTVLVPSFDLVGSILGVLVFIAASYTDMLDGKIARKHGLITDFGKFIDPLADKMMQWYNPEYCQLILVAHRETPNGSVMLNWTWAVPSHGAIDELGR